MRGTVSTNPRLLSAVAERRAQPVECDVEAVIEVDSRIGPQQRPDLLARYDPAWLIEQQHEQPQRLAAQAHGLAAARQPERRGRERTICEREHHGIAADRSRKQTCVTRV
jgi:hypothetical protein